ESEDLAELNRFCDAMIAIRREIDRVGAEEWPADDNPLRGAPHTAACLAGEWEHPYSRQLAAFPAVDALPEGHPRAAALPEGAPHTPASSNGAVSPGGDGRAKVWPPVRRIDSARGDRNLICSCPPVETFSS
ncbi:MAG: hypothetical protein M3291_14090, partial [Actinomycetota bacterium]|nr:hypothetical protein [Actinomycetota bacterium]